MLIARSNQMGMRLQRTGQHLVIIGIVLSACPCWLRCHFFPHFSRNPRHLSVFSLAGFDFLNASLPAF